MEHKHVLASIVRPCTAVEEGGDDVVEHAVLNGASLQQHARSRCYSQQAKEEDAHLYLLLGKVTDAIFRLTPWQLTL